MYRTNLATFLCLGAVGCLPSLGATDVDQPSAADATGRVSVAAVEGATSPLIVDWNPEQRGNLEEAIRDGVAVVSYDGDGLRLLKGCRLSGDYGYMGFTTKTQVVRLETQEDVAANLPLGGLGLAAKIGGELGRGTTLDVALVMVGKRRTSWTDVTVDDLEGATKCDGATHYVRGLTVGAFAMKTGTAQKARVAADIFSAGVSAGSASSKSVDSADGKLADCDEADPESERPPGQCAALLRVELEPIASNAVGERSDETKLSVQSEHNCPSGMHFIAGKCSRQSMGPHLCKANDAADCEKQCGAGHAESCNRLGVLIERRKASGSADAAFDEGCEGGSASACTNLGIRTFRSKDGKRAVSLLEKACRSGDARGCSLAGNAYIDGKTVRRDDRRAVQLLTIGCNGGDYLACTNLGYLYSGAGSIRKNEKRALSLALRACRGGVSTACGNAGLAYEMGMSTTKKPDLAASLFDRACRLSPGACFRSAILSQHGKGGRPKSDEQAKKLYVKACEGGRGGLSSMSCWLAKELYGARTKRPSVAAMRRTKSGMQAQCRQKVVRACSFVGALEAASGNVTGGMKELRKACTSGNPWACDLARRVR